MKSEPESARARRMMRFWISMQLRGPRRGAKGSLGVMSLGRVALLGELGAWSLLWLHHSSRGNASDDACAPLPAKTLRSLDFFRTPQ